MAGGSPRVVGGGGKALWPLWRVVPSRACGGHDRGPGDKRKTGAANSRAIVQCSSQFVRLWRAKADPLGVGIAQSVKRSIAHLKV